MMKKNPEIGFVSLGCPKALVDSELIITRLRSEGYIIDSAHESVDLVIINTCGFIESAIAESMDTIGDALVNNGKVIVTGCLGGDKVKIMNAFPQLLAVTGPHSMPEVVAAVHQHLPPPHDPYINLIPPQGIKLTPAHYAYLKISEGCNHRCTFCIIPSLRGDLVSRPINSVLDEAKCLVDAGVKELLVISQDTSAYGVDLKYQTGFWQGRPIKSRFYELCQQLGELGIWIRLHYVYPYPHVDAILPLMAENKILPYLDVPFQHVNQAILKHMKRPASSENLLKRIESWREICPELTLRSTFIVGFPGETDQAFEELLDFLAIAKIDRVGCFQFSPVNGAKANQLPNQINEEVKQDRYDRLMLLQQQLSFENLSQKRNKIMPVIIDEVNPENIIARGFADAPEVDGNILLKNTHHVEPGDIINVKITTNDAYDLYGKILD